MFDRRINRYMYGRENDVDDKNDEYSGSDDNVDDTVNAESNNNEFGLRIDDNEEDNDNYDDIVQDNADEDQDESNEDTYTSDNSISSLLDMYSQGNHSIDDFIRNNRH